MFTLFFYMLIFITGLVTGSLLNRLIDCLPLMIKAKQFAQCCALLSMSASENNQINPLMQASQCRQCKAPLLLRHTIPLFSYFWLKGRCYQCNARLSLRYPLIELLTALLFTALLWQYNDAMLYILFGMIFIAILLCIAFIDWEQQLLPDSLTLGLLWIGLIANTQIFYSLLPNAVLSAAGTWLFLWLFSTLYAALTKKPGMHHGNMKLLAAFGAWFGAIDLPFILLFSLLSRSMVRMIHRRFPKKSIERPIPLGPFLCLGGLLVLFFEESMLNFYMGLAFYLMYLIFP